MVTSRRGVVLVRGQTMAQASVKLGSKLGLRSVRWIINKKLKKEKQYIVTQKHGFFWCRNDRIDA